MTLPNLFVIGAPKCGTTSMHRYLDQHPRVAMSAVKEPKYFVARGRRPAHHGPGDEVATRRYVVERAAYERLFHYPDGPGAFAGESSPYYLWDPEAAPAIRELVPDARLVAILREPSMRAYSNWADLREQGREKLDFEPALAAEDQRRADGWEPFWLYRSLGLYGEQLARLFEVFPRDQVKVVLAEDLAERPPDVMDEVFEFLGLEPLGAALVDERLNQTMYKPVDRRSRLAESVFTGAQRLRPVVPVPVRRIARRVVRRRLQAQATTGARGRELRARYGSLFAEDRPILDALGIDVSRWDEPSGARGG